MLETIRIRIDKITAAKVKLAVGVDSRAVGKPPVEMYDIELRVSDERWETIKTLCARQAGPRSPWGKKIVSLFNKPIGSAAKPAGGYIIVYHSRKYTSEELNSATHFRWEPKVRSVLDRGINEENMVYDTSHECEYCRFGWAQINDFTFKQKAFNEKDLAFTVFGRNELIVHESVKQIIRDAAPNDVTFRSIRSSRSNEIIDNWYQMEIIRKVNLCYPETKFGYDPLYPEPRHNSACPLGHTKGPWLLSELHVPAKELINSDIAITSDFQGGIATVSLPAPLVIISKRLYASLQKAFPRLKLPVDVVRVRG